MNGEKTYQSTKFTVLHDEEKSQSRKKKRFMLLIVATLPVVIAIPSACYYYHLFFESEYQKENKTSTTFSPSGNLTATDKPEDLFIIFPPKNWVSTANQGNVAKHSSELLCGKPQELPSAVSLRDFISQTYPATVDHFINVDLLLYYEHVINKHDSRRLRIIFEDYEKKLSAVSDLQSFLNFLNTFKSGKFKYYARYLKKRNLKLEDFKYFFDLTHELRLWYIYLDSMRGFLINYKQQKHRESYKVVVTENNFEKFTKKTKERLFHFPNTFSVTRKKLKEINEIITEWTSPTNVIINDTSVVVHNKVLLSSQIKLLNTSSVKSLYAFATHTFYLDENLTLPGVNLAIIAPRWVFLKKIKINLSGRVGENHESETAEDENVGEPGKPGENAGDFIGVGDMNEKFLTIAADGGRGGKGQNGAAGRPGLNNTRPGPPVKKPTCVFKLYSFNNSFGQVVTHYKIYNQDGCGRPGMDGGVGGEGGKGGNVILINAQSRVSITRGSDGMRGLAGKGGEGGMGGRNGCFIEVFDVDDKVLHSITAVKCPQENILPSGNPGRDNRNTQAQIYPPEKVNLSVSDSLFSFFKVAGDDFSRFNDSIIPAFFGQLNLDVLFYNVKNFRGAFEILEKLKKLEFYQVLENKFDERLRVSGKDQSGFSYLRTLVLGKMLILKGNINYVFIDFDDYLNTIQRNIENINEDNLATYSPSVLNTKAGSKLEKIRDSLNAMKSKLVILDEENEKSINKFMMSPHNQDVTWDYEVLARALQGRRLLSTTLTVVELMIRFVNIARDPSRSKEKVEFKNLLIRVVLSHDDSQRKKEEFFHRLNHLSSSQKKILSQIALSSAEYEDHPEIFTKVTDLIRSLPQEDIFVRILENFYTENSPKSRKLIGKLKEVVDSLSTESEVLFAEWKILLKDLTDELDHLMEVYYLVERRELEKSFLNSLNDWKFNGGEEEIKFFKSRLREVVIILEYNLAVDATQAKLYSLRTLNRELKPTRDFAREALAQINHLRKIGRQVPICADIQEAAFDKHSAVGEFYFWSNPEIRSKLKDLFRGYEIRLKSDLNNRHVLDKNFIRFKSLKVELECTNSSFRRILDDFQMKITHSGYSYYNWRGDTEMRITEEVNFNYGFKIQRNGEPELYSALFKKFQAGDITLSPYTTWTLRLLPINKAADYDKLIPFSEVVDLRLVGTGTFIP